MNPQHLSALLARRHNLIPGAAHTYSKGDDQFPAIAPPAILRGKGAFVWGSDGNRYLDWCMGLRSVSLGHVHSVVNRAVKRQMREGTNFGRPHVSEYVLADKLTSLLPGVEMVKFGKNGSTVTTAAAKLARAYTGRKIIARCAEHPFFSFDDWFIGTTACDAGIPQEVTALTALFHYNDLASLEAVFAAHPNQVACVMMEAVTTDEPAPGFLQGVQALCQKHGAVFIVDEMITGFRWDVKGACATYGIQPDLVTYGKGIANGYSLSVLGGRKEIMELGGIRHDKPRVFLMSTTHGAESISLAAAGATIDIMERERVPEEFWQRGARLRQGLEEAIRRQGVESSVSVVGFAPNLSMAFKDANGNVSAALRTFFLQEVIRRGVLFQGYFALSHAHQEAEIVRTIEVFEEALGEYRQVLDAGGDPGERLVGEPCKPVFRKWNAGS